MKLILAFVCLFALTLTQDNVDPSSIKIKTAKGVDLNDPMTSFSSLDEIFEQYIPKEKLKQIYRVLYGSGADDKTNNIPNDLIEFAEIHNFELKYHSMVKNAYEEQKRKRRVVKIGLIQNSISEPTNETVSVQVSFLLFTLV